MKVKDITPEQLRDFSVIERVCSVFSLLGCIFIVTTFLGSSYFRKPITRLVFYASVGNLMVNVATLMARSYVGSPLSAGCQFQAFLIQMFMAADAFWTLAMAVNVYLTFYRKYDAQKLKKMELPYLLVCYGAPFVVALTYVFISTPERGSMYGNALLWCWVSSRWNIWRIATFYGPVWVTIFLTFFIYIRTGRQIYRRYKQLRSLNSGSREPEPHLIMEPFSTKTTEVYLTSEIVSTTFGPGGANASQRASAAVGAPSAPTAAYFVTITAEPRRQPTPTYDHDDNVVDDEEEDDENVEDGDEIRPIPSKTNTDMIIPIPTPASPITPRWPLAPLSPTSPTSPFSDASGGLERPTARNITRARRRNRRKLAVYEANNAAWSYTQCALLFFTALLVTWIPSTANRVYSVINHDEVSLGLQYASAFVLPLQGFWNGLIYVFTTRRACRRLARDLVAGMLPVRKRAGLGKGPLGSKIELNDGSHSSVDTKRQQERSSFVFGFVPEN